MATDTEKAMPFKKKPSLMIEMDAERPSKDDMTTDEDETDSDLDAAAGEMFDCLKSDDREGFVTAVKAVKSCK